MARLQGLFQRWAPLLLVFALFTITVQSAMAGYGLWAYYVIINPNAVGTTYYGNDPSCLDPCPNPPFNGTNLGAYASSSTLVLEGGEAKTWETAPDDVTSVTMYYRVYLNTETPPAYSAVPLTNETYIGGNDTKWDRTDLTVDLLANISVTGSYNVDVYYEYLGNFSAPDAVTPTYTATFTYEAPTATTIALYDVNSEADGLRATWATISEESTEGFDLFRSETVGELGTKVNEAMIPAQNSGAAVGASYDLLDTDVLSGRLYYYTLVVHDGDGTSQNIGPVEAVYESPTALTLGAMDSARPTPSGALALAGAGLLALGLAAVRRRRMAQRRRAAKA
ncbi:MAG: hypothetical protein KDD73_03315 [Anaerolineales bacterium]|nr:hypothetical protein [Anaerolineales bacterium]MCB9128877.1 hypothetical protein [Ardenticatenales bacterium]MCB9172859.1 hypothetical protein [Ardenticatenales bacterium]